MKDPEIADFSKRIYNIPDKHEQEAPMSNFNSREVARQIIHALPLPGEDGEKNISDVAVILDAALLAVNP